MTSQPRWRRRKEARPGDIVAAGLGVFAEKGFAGARMEEIARRAGVSKGTLYLYFETKEDVFRAVVREVVVPNVDAVRAAILTADLPFPALIRTFLPRLAEIIINVPIGAVAKMVVGESRNFPELAKVWHDDVVQKAVGVISELIARAQARGEVRPGNPRIHAFSIVGPMMLGAIWRETFTPIGGADPDLPTIARQHAETVLGGLLTEEARP
ncbi:TetR/AcrR family transcriptional regulator [Sphingosinicella sp. LHD-64]|uniref:TetR/AcrR family transcriptional regulator n=1 Tax=Sphingosinicella sp. LHD-64 TaxID=3072139 RepID=UPI00280EB675|nr:TetR/AcrR family transcriptional regulator [Sphingosinicella sp. LHD-64]MDQ8755616.1 TetR/AcrR family transcriptional regulator [Sphingosinicella sp. LHD-64]